MSTRIRVILLEDIPDVGTAGDIVSVTEGFARNALFPSGKAALATTKLVSRAEHNKQAARKVEEQELARRQKEAEAIDGTELTLVARAKNDEDIFGAITAANVAEELEKANIAVAAKDIKLPSKKITKLGTYEAVISFGSGVEATIQLIVAPVEGEKTAEE